MLYMSSQCTNDGSYTLTRHLQARRRPEHGPGAGAEPRQPGPAAAARRDQADRRDHAQAVARHPAGHRHQLARRPLRPALPEQLRRACRSRTSWPACRASATSFMFGQRDYSMRIWVDPDKLAAREPDGRRRRARPSASRTRQVAAGPIGQPPMRRRPAVRRSRSPRWAGSTEVEQFENIIVKADARRPDRPRSRTSAASSWAPRTRTSACMFDGKPTRQPGHLPAARRQRPRHRRPRHGQDGRAEARTFPTDVDLRDRLRHHAVHPRVDRRGLQDAARRGHPGRPRRAALPAELAVGASSR